jgi:23S rRNA (pseudouridine1915-N3)-methyltransferase
MQFHLIAVGSRMPTWITKGFQEYQNRLSSACKLNLITIASPKRTKHSNVLQLLVKEEEKILTAIPKQSRVIALDEKGILLNTKQLAQKLKQWQLEKPDTALLIGGPDGLGKRCLNHAEYSWSLSPLTLPHPLVRIIVAEQLYRAWTLLQGHPYHRD